MRALAFLACLVALPSITQAQVQGEGATDIWRYYAARAAHIQLVGIQFNGMIESAAQGSGFLLDDRHILTNDHVVPDVAFKYETLETNVRLRSRKGPAIPATVVARDPVNDLALLELATPLPPLPYCPVGALMPPAVLPPGSQLYLMGFPLDRNLKVAPGLLGSDDDGGLWQTDSPLNNGNSGGPVFSSKGYLVAVAVGGVTSWTTGGKTVDVDGIYDLVPIARLKTSPVGQWLAQHSSSDCWREHTALPGPDQFAWTQESQAVAAAIIPGGAIGPGWAVAVASEAADPIATDPLPPPAPTISSEASAPEEPEDVAVSYTLSQVKDDHGLAAGSKAYRKVFNAQSGFLIEECDFSAASANHESKVSCEIAPDRKSAILSFTLQSGPFFDRWRGWLRGTVSLNQRRADLLAGTAVHNLQTLRVPVETVQSDHAAATPTSRTYSKAFEVHPGYLIVDCAFESISDNNADAIECRIDGSGRQGSLSYELTSGPLFDRWRGWLKGDVVLRMVKAE